MYKVSDEDLVRIRVAPWYKSRQVVPLADLRKTVPLGGLADLRKTVPLGGLADLRKTVLLGGLTDLRKTVFFSTYWMVWQTSVILSSSLHTGRPP